MKQWLGIILTLAVMTTMVLGCHGDFTREYTTLSAELEMARQRGGAWCAPSDFASAETHLFLARAEFEQGNHEAAKRLLNKAEPEVEAALEQCSDCKTDLDFDGILDMDDQDPYRAEDYDGWEDEDGIPDPDNDGDGLVDDEDECPTSPEDYDNFQDYDGCPEIDNDGDGIPDGRDDCTMDAEDMDQWEDRDGCPEPDNDSDGFLDSIDACPNAPETENGFLDDDGCPDFIPKVRKVVPLPKVKFVGRYEKLTKPSILELQEFAEHLQSNNELYVRIEGFCRVFGSMDALKLRTKNRAELVKKVLVDFGVEEDRIITFGFGREDNSRKSGYWVQLVIYQR